MSCTYCNDGCCTTKVPVRDSSHAKCHCQDTKLCESPVLQKNVTTCGNGCCTSTTVNIKNADQVYQYVDALQAEHMGYSEHNLYRTLEDLSNGKISCPNVGNNVPDMHYTTLNCPTVKTQCCDTDLLCLANRVKGAFNRCRTYGDVSEFIREIPTAGVYIVNYEFIDLLIDEITGDLPVQNLSQAVTKKVKEYVALYYAYYKNLNKVGAVALNDLVPLEKNLIFSAQESARIKAILIALDNRLNGKVCSYEQ